ncbi:signal peptidase II [Candidatus Legionella polyplacis]|uniref:Lipoprotein signal peptidase n=1 Tax=Candidatus Legionella polyplacis TaxID=2005262 RepID=A0ABZ2H1E1_9GAMM
MFRYYLIIFIIFLIDQSIKLFFICFYISFIYQFNFFIINNIPIYNNGTIFGILNFLNCWFFIFIDSIILLFFMKCLFFFKKKHSVIRSLSISLIIGGGLSNLFDRIRLGYIIDYIYVNYNKNYNLVLNIADICIVIGVIIIFIIPIINRN